MSAPLDRMRAARIARLDDAGLSIVEVVVATAIAGLVFGAIASTIVIGIRIFQSTFVNISASSTLETVDLYFRPDVWSASSATITASPPDQCGPGEAIVQFTDDYVDENFQTTTRYVSYAYQDDPTPNDGISRNMYRHTCEDDNGEPAAPLTTATLATNLSQTSAPLASCLPGPCGPSTREVLLQVWDFDGRELRFLAGRRQQ